LRLKFEVDALPPPFSLAQQWAGNSFVGLPRRCWYCQLLEDEEGNELHEIVKRKTGEFSSMILHKITQC
jgi:hypothetical protein